MAHPYQKHREGTASKARVKHILKADGGPVPTTAEMDRAKKFMRGVEQLGRDGGWEGKDAFQLGAEQTKAYSDRMRPDSPEDKGIK